MAADSQLHPGHLGHETYGPSSLSKFFLLFSFWRPSFLPNAALSGQLLPEDRLSGQPSTRICCTKHVRNLHPLVCRSHKLGRPLSHLLSPARCLFRKVKNGVLNYVLVKAGSIITFSPDEGKEIRRRVWPQPSDVPRSRLATSRQYARGGL